MQCWKFWWDHVEWIQWCWWREKRCTMTEAGEVVTWSGRRWDWTVRVAAFSANSKRRRYRRMKHTGRRKLRRIFIRKNEKKRKRSRQSFTWHVVVLGGQSTSRTDGPYWRWPVGFSWLLCERYDSFASNANPRASSSSLMLTSLNPVTTLLTNRLPWTTDPSTEYT